MKRLLMLFLMVITAVIGVHAEIMTGKEKRGINYAYNTDTYTMTFWGNGKMGDYGGYDYGTVSPFDVNGIFDIRLAIFEEGITRIGGYSLMGQNLRKVVLPEGLIEIGGYAFSGCDIDSLIIPNTVTSIEEKAFRNNTNLVDVILSDNLETIGSEAFSGCGIHSIVIPNSVSTIDYSAFAENRNLTNVKCDRNKKFDYIGRGIFRNCPLSHEIIFFDELVFVPNDVSEYIVPDYVTSINDAFYKNTNLKSVKLPESIMTLKDYCFSGCTSLQSLDIPESVSVIGSNCFSGCTSLQSVNIPKSISDIKSDCFSGCSSLEKIDLPEGLTTISSYAFYNTSIDTITILPVVTSIGKKALATNKETTIFFWPLLESGNYDGEFCNENAKLYLQEADMETYPGALSLNKCYIDANFDIEFGKVEFTLDPKIPSVEIKEVFYRKEDADDYVMISSDANGAYAFPVDMGLPYLIKVDMTIDGLDRTLYYKVPTVFYPSYSFEEATQTSISFKLTSLFADILDGYGIHRSSIYYPADAEGNVVVDNLRPGNTYEFHTYGIYKGEIYSSPDEYVLPITTGQISPSISAEVSPTTIKATGSYIHGDATIINSGFEHNAEFFGEDSILITGLVPGYNYYLYYVVNTEEGGSYRVDKSITMSNLRLETGTAKPTSKTSVLLVAATNIDNAETNVGFQWRRHDAPEDMPSDYIKCPVIDGVMECSIRNLNPEVYYQFRPYYRSSNGSEYFGEWMVFFTGDATAYVDPNVHTMGATNVTVNGATLTGYVLQGSDEIIRQGFEYWPVLDLEEDVTERKTVLASGLNMKADITGLTPATTYAFRAFVTTEKGTTYGSEMQFTTIQQASGIDEVNSQSRFTVVLRNNPVYGGSAWVKVMGASKRELRYTVTTLSGMRVGDGTLLAEDDWNSVDVSLSAGLYLFMVSDGVNSSTTKLIVR